MFTIVFGRGKNRVVLPAGEYDIEVATIYLKGYIKERKEDDV